MEKDLILLLEDNGRGTYLCTMLIGERKLINELPWNEPVALWRKKLMETVRNKNNESWVGEYQLPSTDNKEKVLEAVKFIENDTKHRRESGVSIVADIFEIVGTIVEKKTVKDIIRAKRGEEVTIVVSSLNPYEKGTKILLNGKWMGMYR